MILGVTSVGGVIAGAAAWAWARYGHRGCGRHRGRDAPRGRRTRSRPAASETGALRTAASAVRTRSLLPSPAARTRTTARPAGSAGGAGVVRLELQRRPGAAGDAQELERVALVHLAEHRDRLDVRGPPGRGARFRPARPQAEREARPVGGRRALEVVDEAGRRPRPRDAPDRRTAASRTSSASARRIERNATRYHSPSPSWRAASVQSKAVRDRECRVGLGDRCEGGECVHWRAASAARWHDCQMTERTDAISR